MIQKILSLGIRSAEHRTLLNEIGCKYVHVFGVFANFWAKKIKNY